MKVTVKKITKNCNDKPTNYYYHKLLNKINKYVGLIAIVIPLLAGLITFLIKFGLYRYYEGYLINYNIDFAKMSPMNNVYWFLTSIVILIYIIICSSVISIKTKDDSKPIKKFINKHIALILFNVPLILFELGKINLISIGLSILGSIILIILEYGLYFLIFKGILNIQYFSSHFLKTEDSIRFFYIAILTSILILSFSFIPYNHGIEKSEDKKEFKIISDNEVIVFETDNKFYIEQYILNDSGNTIYINTNVQKEINKTDIAITIKTYKNFEIDPGFKKYNKS